MASLPASAVSPKAPKSYLHEDSYSISEDEAPVNPEAEALLTRATTLLGEVEAFQKSLRRNRLDKSVELRHFLSGVKSARQSILGLTLQAPTSSKTRHTLRSSNLFYLECVWLAAKSTTGITALTKTFHISEEGEKREDGKPGKRQKSTVSIDVIAQNGLQWIKVCTLNMRRLLFDIAKESWSDISPTTSSDEATPTPTPHQTSLAIPHLPLIKLAHTLQKAASQTRIQYLHPQVTFHFPYLPAPSTSAILSSFVSALLATGARVQCGTETLSPVELFTLLEDLELNSARTATFTPTLNIDTTILLALISDITHQDVVPEPRFHPAILKQLRTESERPLLPKILLPTLGPRSLVCTASARNRFQEIAGIIASPTELARAELLFAPLSVSETAEERLASFRALSKHPIPALSLPIRVLPEDYTSILSSEDPMVHVSKSLSAINRSVFITGWKLGLTTVTSNRTVAKLVERLVEEDVVGPDVFVVSMARGLVGRAKKIDVE